MARPIALTAASQAFPAGRSGRLSILLHGKAEAALRAYLARHKHARLRITVRLTIRNGDGSRGTQTISSLIAGSRNIAGL